MRPSTRASLLAIGVALMLLSPVTCAIKHMYFDGAITMTLGELYRGVISWGLVFAAGALIMLAVLWDSNGRPPSRQ